MKADISTLHKPDILILRRHAVKRHLTDLIFDGMHVLISLLLAHNLTLVLNSPGERSLQMRKRLNEQLSVQYAFLIMVSAVLLILVSATIAKACSFTATKGCDVGCAVQFINDCPEFYECTLRSCQWDTCSSCPGKQCGRGCGQVFNTPCGGCADYRYGCKALAKCCPQTGGD
jgi:hypothetical protein